MVRSILSNWAGLVVLGIVSVILTPILIHSLGNFYYGMWIMVGSAVDYYGLLEMGMRWTLFRFIAAYKGDRDRKFLNEILATAMAVVAGIGGLLAALTVVLMFVFPKFFRLSGADAHVFQRLMLLLGLTVALAFPGQYLSAYLRGLQRFDLYNLGLVTVAVVRAVLLVAVLRLGFGVIAVAIVTLGIGVLSIPVNWMLVRRADPLLSLSMRQASWHRARELLSYSFYVFTTNVGEYLRFYTDSLVIGRVLGVALVTPFSIATRLMEYFRSIMSAVNGPLMVQLSELDESRTDELRQAFLQGTKITTLLSLLLGSVLLLNGRTLIRLWVGEGFVSVYSLMFVLTVGYMIAFAQNPCQLLIFARARQHRALAWWTLAEGIANLGLSIYWARRFGLLGVALGTAVPLMFVKLFVQPWYALRELSVSLRDYVFKALARPIVVSSIFLVFCWLFTPSVVGGFWRFGMTMSWQTVLFGALAYTVGLVSDERQLIRLRGRKIVTSLRLIRVAG